MLYRRHLSEVGTDAMIAQVIPAAVGMKEVNSAEHDELFSYEYCCYRGGAAV